MALFTESQIAYTAQNTKHALIGYFQIMLHLISKSLHHHLRRLPEGNVALSPPNKDWQLYFVFILHRLDVLL